MATNEIEVLKRENAELREVLQKAEGMLNTVAQCATHECEDCREHAGIHRDQISNLLERYKAPAADADGRTDWAALGYVVGATVEQDSGTSWADRATITHVHENGALDVVKNGVAYGLSASRCKPVADVTGKKS